MRNINVKSQIMIKIKLKQVLNYIYIIIAIIIMRLNVNFHGKNDKNKKHILIAPVRLDSSHYLEYIYAAYLSAHGNCVHALIDLDGKLAFRDFLKWKKNNWRNWIQVFLIKIICFAARINILQITHFESNNVLIIGRGDLHVESTIRRLRFANVIDENEVEETRDKVRRDVYNIYQSLKSANIQFDYAFISHGIYSQWGPVFDYIIENKSLCFINGSLPYYGNSFYISTNPFQVSLPCRIKNRNANLSSILAKDVLDNRLNLSSNDQKSFSFRKEDSQLKKNIAEIIDKYSTSIAFFPNCLWDGNIKERDSLFESLLDCINSTIASVQPDTLIVIRAHPAESTLWSSYAKINEFIVKRENVLFIDSSSAVSSHYVADLCNINVVYDGILALEFAYREIAVVVPSNSYYRHCPGVTTFKDASSYLNFMANISKTFNKQASLASSNGSIRARVIDWIESNFLQNRIYFSGYVMDGEPLTSKIISSGFDLVSFVELEGHIENEIESSKTNSR